MSRKYIVEIAENRNEAKMTARQKDEREPINPKSVLSILTAFLIGFGLSYLFFNVVISDCKLSESHDDDFSFPPDVADGRPTSPNETRLTIQEMLLPKNVRPELYELQLKAWMPGYEANIPKDKELTFDATVIAHLVATEPTNSVVLHSVGLEYEKEKCVAMNDNGDITVTAIEIDERLQHVRFKLASPISGTFRLKVVYRGRVNKDLSGLYQTRYQNSNDETKIAAVTQMEPVDARKMVPCFDEPEWKAKWNVTLIYPKGTRAVANGIEEGDPQSIDGDFMIQKFRQTPAMSSYLLAILISDFEYKEAQTKSGVRFRIWCRPEAMETTNYALESGIKVLEGLEEFYGVKFPLEKQDMVALPDFAMGAMENWGLITYRETALLYDEKNSYLSNKQRVATVIAHELAHMWFGNLVTMKWWDDIWLNEGFASFMENIGVDIISDNTFEMETQFVAMQHYTTLDRDGTKTSHPIVNKVQYSEDLNDVFDAISYQKGASFISMIRRILGEKPFQQAITNYLNAYAYRNAEHMDLFAEMDQVVREDLKGPDGRRFNVTEFSLKWMLQMGYPYLELVDANSTHYEVTQTRFVVDPKVKENDKFTNPPYGYEWDVPVWYQVGSAEIQMAWLPYKGKLYLPKSSETLVLNADSYAIARTNYNEAEWRRILEQLKTDSSIYSQRTKYRLLMDVFSMAMLNKVDLSVALDFGDYLQKNERQNYPWQAFFTALTNIRQMFGSDPLALPIDDYLKKLLTPIIENLDIDQLAAEITTEEAYMKKGHQVIQWTQYCSVNNAACRAKKQEIFTQGYRQSCSVDQPSQQSSQCTQVPNAVRANIYCHAVKYGDEEDFRLMMEKYKKEKYQLESAKLLNALSCTSDVTTLKYLLKEVLNRDTGIIRGQDAGSFLSSIAENKVAAGFLLDYFLANWETIYKTFAQDQSILNKLITSAGSTIANRYQLEKLKLFFKTDKQAAKYDSFNTSIKKAENRIEWIEQNGEEVAKLFKEKAAKL